MVVAKSIKSVMDLPSNFFQVIQDIVLKPDFTSAVALFWFSFLNELVAVLPYVVLVSGQLLFLKVSSFHVILSQFFFFIAIPAGVGGAIGSLLTYGLAYFGGKPLIDKFQRYLRFSWGSIEKINRYFKGAWYDELIFLALRSVPALPSLPVNIAAGILRIPPARYFILTTAGFIIRMMILFAFIWAGAETLAQ